MKRRPDVRQAAANNTEAAGHMREVSGDAPPAVISLKAANEHTVRLFEVAHGRTLGKELGVGHHLERHTCECNHACGPTQQQQQMKG
jgi:hypothetical protein